MFIPCLSFIFKGAYLKQLDFGISAILNEFWNSSNGMVIEP